MKKILGVIVIVIVMTFSVSVLANKFYKSYKINISEEDKEASVKFKGLTSAKDFAEDNNGNFYIAFSNRIQFVNSIGKSYNIFKDNNLNICLLYTSPSPRD